MSTAHTIAFIDGEAHEIRHGETILQFAKRHIGEDYIPTLCDDPRLKPHGACRVCSVEVALQADGPIRTVASCHTPIAPGMHIFAQSESIQALRKNIVELVLTDHPLDCLTCEVNGNCQLQDVTQKSKGNKNKKIISKNEKKIKQKKKNRKNII